MRANFGWHFGSLLNPLVPNDNMSPFGTLTKSANDIQRVNDDILLALSASVPNDDISSFDTKSDNPELLLKENYQSHTSHKHTCE